MPRITESQLRTLIREGISEVQTEMYSRNLSRRLNLKIAERKIVHLQNLINEATGVLGDSRLNEGWLDNIKSKFKDTASEFKGGVGAAASALGRAYVPGYSKEGGLKSRDIQKMSMSAKPSEVLMKKIEPALAKLKNIKVGDLENLSGLTALDEYVKAVAEAKKSIEELLIMYNKTDSIESMDTEYLSVSEKIIKHFNQAKQFLATLQDQLERAAHDLAKDSIPSKGLKNITPAQFKLEV